jgi:hypothetical protein
MIGATIHGVITVRSAHEEDHARDTQA